MDNNLLMDDFQHQIKVSYKEEHYSVRDNGTVLRHSRTGKRPRPTDNQWTFGKPNDKTGYLEIAAVRVHRIVATAFHGEPPTKEHVTDHKDTNKHNNRPENLRWVTRLENIVLNPITAKRISLVCGSVEAFLADPSKFRDQFPEPNFQWMCTVSPEAAQISLARLQAWAASDQPPSGGSLGEWIFNRTIVPRQPAILVPREPAEIVPAKTPHAAQRNWRTPSEFPCCPQQQAEEPLAAYAENLLPGSVFCRNDLYISLVSKCTLSSERQVLYVLTETLDAIKPWALAQITFEEGLFVHASLGSFFQQEGTEKQYCLAQGLEWTGGDSIDDYC